MRLLLDEAESIETSRLHSIINRVADKADEVFIWALLVINDLIRKSSDATLDDMAAIVTSCPRKLAEFYTRVFHPVEPARMQDCLIMLEIILRGESLSLHQVAGIVACARVKIAKEFPPSMGATDLSQIKRQIADCHGFLQIVGEQENDPNKAGRIQFLLQTLKE